MKTLNFGLGICFAPHRDDGSATISSTNGAGGTATGKYKIGTDQIDHTLTYNADRIVVPGSGRASKS